MHLREAATYLFKELVACVLKVVLIVGIVDHALNIALIVTHLHPVPVDIFFHKP